MIEIRDVPVSSDGTGGHVREESGDEDSLNTEIQHKCSSLVDQRSSDRKLNGKGHLMLHYPTF